MYVSINFSHPASANSVRVATVAGNYGPKFTSDHNIFSTAYDLARFMLDTLEFFLDI